MSRSELADMDLVACMDGPMQGQWFEAGEWLERLAAAARMRDVFDQPPAACLGYIEANWLSDKVQHPRLKSVNGVPLFYRDMSRSQTPSHNPPPARRLSDR